MQAVMLEEHNSMVRRLEGEIERLEGRLADLKSATDAKLAQLRRQAEAAGGDETKRAVLLGAQRLVKIKVRPGSGGA